MARAKRELLLRVHRHRLRGRISRTATARRRSSCSRTRARRALLQPRRTSRTLSSSGFSRGSTIAGARSRDAARCRRRSRRPCRSTASSRSRSSVVDVRAELETLVMLREDLRRVRALAQELTPDQRLVLACQVGLQMAPAEFCRRYGWSPEKYRKVAQRARARLRQLIALDGPRDVPLCAGRVGRADRDRPMSISPPTHRRVPWDAGGRLNGRPHGDSHPRASGREPECSPLRLPAARVHRSGAGAMTAAATRAARGLPRVRRGRVPRRRRRARDPCDAGAAVADRQRRRCAGSPAATALRRSRRGARGRGCRDRRAVHDPRRRSDGQTRAIVLAAHAAVCGLAPRAPCGTARVSAPRRSGAERTPREQRLGTRVMRSSRAPGTAAPAPDARAVHRYAAAGVAACPASTLASPRSAPSRSRGAGARARGATADGSAASGRGQSEFGFER